MSILSWNLSAIPTLKYLIHAYHPNVIFMYETLIFSQKLKEIKAHFGFDSCFSVDVNGRSGGLALFWKHPFTCSLLNFSPNFINVEVQIPGKPV